MATELVETLLKDMGRMSQDSQAAINFCSNYTLALCPPALITGDLFFVVFCNKLRYLSVSVIFSSNVCGKRLQTEDSQMCVTVMQ